MACAEQRDVGGELFVGELVAVFLGLHQLRGQVVARLFSPELEQLLEIHRGHRVAGIAYRISSGDSGTGSSKRPPSREPA